MEEKEISLTNDELAEKATKLTGIATRIKIMERLIENIEYSRIKKDDFAIHYQINSGLLGDIKGNLSEIKGEIQVISNEICPD
ncbi:hypothetical protein BCR24_15560 [Enterococcus ureilyticus]|uniref:Uncharacterized protein n=1 Tax=Enterococcus ureilyticus TaxID=1131292 RepID=A0A1E5HC86_9ENTE|nr:hypothetical protein [Enterococcus ureilyticus]MBM7690203.1 hypothetical protein [Enterococcus ureilyticus]OEG22435.1 hypothetical protein BCR24_15560 [Enterococcus ureilyticus]